VRALVHLASCGGAGSGGGVGHTLAEARWRASLGRANLFFGSRCGCMADEGACVVVIHLGITAEGVPQELIFRVQFWPAHLNSGAVIATMGVGVAPSKELAERNRSNAAWEQNEGNALTVIARHYKFSCGGAGSGGGVGHTRAEARRHVSLGRALVHMVSCGGAGSGGGEGHTRAEARRRDSLRRASVHSVSCGGAGSSGGGAGHTRAEVRRRDSLKRGSLSQLRRCWQQWRWRWRKPHSC